MYWYCSINRIKITVLSTQSSYNLISDTIQMMFRTVTKVNCHNRHRDCSVLAWCKTVTTTPPPPPRYLPFNRETFCRERQSKTSVRLTCKSLTTRILVLPFARQMYVCYTTIVIGKYDFNGHPTLRVATCLQTKLYLTHMTLT